MKKLGLLLASMLFVLSLSAQTPEKKECCKDKAKTECTAKDKKDAKSKDAACCSKDKDSKKECAKKADGATCCKDKAKAADKK